MIKGVDIEIAPLDEEHVRAKITWSEQDVGGGKIVVEVTVKNMKAAQKPTSNLGQMRRRLPCDLHEPLPIRLRISIGMTLVDLPFSGGDYFDVIMRVGRPTWRGARLRRTG